MTIDISTRRARYAWGGDEFLFVEMDESMSLGAFQRVSSLANAVEVSHIEGVTDICQTNTSMLLRYNPDLIAPLQLKRRVQDLEEALNNGSRSVTAQTRILELPVWYNDPITQEVMERFRPNHQAPDKTDLEYVAEENNLSGQTELIERHHGSPWMVTAVGFVAGLPFMYQLTPQAEQIEAPKYLSPRTDTPPLTVGHAGCFCCIYSVRGAGGYQMFGLAAAPIFEPNSALVDFQESMILFRAGDIVKFRPVDKDEYDAIQQQCADGTFRYSIAQVEFDLAEWERDPAKYNLKLTEALHGADN
ncbi:allophanate hydrolase subunit 1 [Paenarthrobacter sp. YJN-5]|uniref:5-oxoprolinase subunit B family protein n=1 Tax=Paenarthrobacter sp. YJN-5 TaxID=2735316 RepID=UPI0018786386|nr:carboxyltransferase domain-containing protein [Paenarthrobacter sp. YJN-5]QOT19855.1 carboxyltransferase domain-containing protein [Paenarthrobacter sp. YJN-5]